MLFRLLVLLAMPSVAYAFPLVQGSNILASTIGIFASLGAAMLPKSLFKKGKVSGCIALFSLCLVAYTTHLYLQLDTELISIQTAQKSRDRVNLPLDIMLREKAEFDAIDLTDEEYDFWASHKAQIHVWREHDWKKQSKEDGFWLSSVVTGKYSVTPKTEYFKSYTPYEAEALVGYASLNELSLSKGVLYSQHPALAIKMLKSVYEKTGVLLDLYLPNSVGVPWETSGVDIPKTHMIDSGNNLFDLNLYELKSADDVRETNTLVNAKLFSYSDMDLAPDWLIRELFKGKEAVFIDAFGVYGGVHRNLIKAGVLDHKFVDQGSQGHYDKGAHITPPYFNNRDLRPLDVEVLYANTDRVRFLCVNEKTCTPNLPFSETFTLNYDYKDRDGFMEEIESLPKDYLYVTIKNDHESTGAAYLAGYALSRSGHNFVGHLPISHRFSQDNVKLHVLENSDYLALTEYRERPLSKGVLAKYIESSVLEYGWLAAFVAGGVLFRLLLLPMQSSLVFGYYFKNKHSKVKSALLAIVSLSSLAVLIFAYLEIVALIGDYAAVPHKVLLDISPSLESVLYLVFISLVLFQSFISFPSKRSIFYGVVVLMAGVYFGGLIQMIPTPLIAFSIGAEFTALMFQLPIYALYRLEVARNRKGVYRYPLVGSSVTYPEKWELLQYTKGFVGTLLSSRASDSTLVAVCERELLQSEKIIVRSCSSQERENRLGGYYQSYVVCDLTDAISSIKELSDLGCDYVLVQPFIDSENYGVASSINDDGTGIGFAIGAGDSATEGLSGVTRGVIPRNKKGGDLFAAKLRRAMREAERVAGGAASIEFAVLSGMNVRILQIRKLQGDAADKIYPLDISHYMIAEEYYARPSYTTGSCIEHFTKGAVIYFRGFSFRLRSDNKIRLAPRARGIKRVVASIDKKLSESEVANLPSADHKAFWLSRLGEVLEDLAGLYDLTQRKQRGVPPSNSLAVIESSISELEVSGRMVFVGFSSDEGVVMRDFIHNRIVACNFLLNECVRSILGVDEVPNDIDVPKLLDPVSSNIEASPQSLRTLDLSGGTRLEKVVSAGMITGKVFNSETNHPMNVSSGYVLCGEEVRSDWVKYLSSFSGVVTVFGHEDSHLAISARELGVPYRIVDKVRYDEILASEYVELD